MIFPFFYAFFAFFRIFFAFLRFSSLFSSSAKGQGQTTAIYCKNGEFHSDPVCTDPVQNFPTVEKRKLRVSFRAKLRPWSELTAKMVMGVVPGLVILTRQQQPEIWKFQNRQSTSAEDHCSPSRPSPGDRIMEKLIGSKKILEAQTWRLAILIGGLFWKSVGLVQNGKCAASRTWEKAVIISATTVVTYK